MTETGDTREALLENVMARHHYAGDALIEILHTAQQLYGYLSPPLLQEIARKLRLPPSRVLGVATFYHLFRFTPPAKHTASVCVGTACYVKGAADLVEAVRRKGWTLEEVRCAGSCGLAPLVVCDGAGLCRVTPAELEAHLEDSYDSGNTPSDSEG
jgi:bidirectional [NiFe] hydrogenase diaphorase subunit